MDLLRRQAWINFLSLLPGTVLTVLTIGVAFLRFYDERDFSFLGLIAQPRIWSNRLTLAALLAALVNFGVEWDNRNRETDRLAQEIQRKAEEEQRRTEEEQRRAEEEQRRREEEQRRREEEQRRAEEEQRRRQDIARAEARRVEKERRRRQDIARAEAQRAEERERATRRARIQNRWVILQIRHQLDPSEQTRAALNDFLSFLQEYEENL